MNRIYFYPNTKSKGSIEFNTGSPYMSFLLDSLKKKFVFVNEHDETGFGIANLFKYIYRTDYILLNWIENIPDKRLGFIQFIILIILLIYAKNKNIKVIWVLHNKISHVKKNIFLKKIIFKRLLNKSDLIITHSTEGIEYAKNTFLADAKNIKFIHHPLMKPVKVMDNKIEYDIIIWGKIWPYKGIDLFLKFATETKLLNKIKILIAGTIYPEDYHQQLKGYESNQVHFIDRFIPDKELDELIGKSKVILFTYNKESVLSSAALMDSLVYINKIIIGPNSGSFADLATENLIYTYNDFDELNKLLLDIDGLKNNAENLKKFINENTWENLGKRITEWIEN